MTETLTGSPAKNYVGGEWHDAASHETYEKRNPWRPEQDNCVYSDTEEADYKEAIPDAQDAITE